MKSVLKKSVLKSLVYSNIVSILFTTLICVMAYKNSLRYESMPFSYLNVVGSYLCTELFLLPILFIFQFIKNWIRHKTDDTIHTDETNDDEADA